MMMEEKWGVPVTFYRKRLFPVLAGLLWLAFLTLDLTGWGDSTWVKFAAICLCCATAFTGMKTTDGKLVALALCLTVGADWFLLVRRGSSQADQMVGIGLFIVVQLIYAFRLCLHRDKWIMPLHLFLRIFLSLTSFFALAFRGQWIESLAAFYFFNLLMNSVEAGGGFYGLTQSNALTHDITCNPLRDRFSWGLLLFFFCDVCVGAYSLGIFVSFTRWGSWLFYLPSQVLIVLSQELEKGDLDEKRF